MTISLGQVRLKAVTTVALVNYSTVLSEIEVKTIIAALQTQVHEHFAPAWGIDAKLHYEGPGEPDPIFNWNWKLYLVDSPEDERVEWKHNATDHHMPVGRVFVGVNETPGTLPSVAISQALLTMLADPWCDRCCEVKTAMGSVLVAREVTDPVRALQHAYEVVLPTGQRIKVSNFVYPLYYSQESYLLGGVRDHEGLVRKPLTVLDGGSITTRRFERWKNSAVEEIHPYTRLARRNQLTVWSGQLGELQTDQEAVISEADAPAANPGSCY